MNGSEFQSNNSRRSSSLYWVSPPGDTIKDLMMVRAVHELSKSTGLPVKLIHDLQDGHVAITKATAGLLSKALGGSVQFWLNREKHYRKRLRQLGAVR